MEALLTEWRALAACADEDPERMFPLGEDETPTASKPWTEATFAGVESARTVCRGCPVRAECLTWAVETKQAAGVWGGLATHERAALGGKVPG